MRRCIFEGHSRVVIDTMFVYLIVDSDLRVEKKRQQKKKIDFEIGAEAPELALISHILFGDKKNSFQKLS